MHVALVVTAAPLAARTGRLLAALDRAGHQATVCVTANAAGWIDPIPESRMLQGRIRPDAVVCCPATFNTLNAWAAGLNNTPALGLLNDAIGLPSRILAVPMVAERLTVHPAWPRSLDTLLGAGVEFMDPHTGEVTRQPSPMVSGSGDAIAQAFAPAWIDAWLKLGDRSPRD